ncbi:MAG: SDR family NAD(P)-dependent oxidoreductase [Thermoleophilia bacterium]
MSTTARPALRDLIDLHGRVAVVTGASMGIGLGIARRLHEAGAAVVMADLRGDLAAEAASLMEAARPDSALAMRADVADEDDVRRMTDEAVALFGRIDILVNNAGIYPNRPLAQMDAATFRRVLDVNLTGAFLCTREAARDMVARGEGGRIVNVTSIDALHPSMVGLAHYDASKHGLWGFTKSSALELAPHGIAVNAVAPGAIRTPGVGQVDEATLDAFAALVPMGRIGLPDDIARAVLFLASDLASYVTGAQLVVDGGRLLS